MFRLTDDGGGGGTPASDASVTDVGEGDNPPANLVDAVSSSAPDGMQKIMDKDGAFVDGWTESLSDDDWADLKPTLSQYKDFHAIAKGLVDGKRKISEKMDGFIKLPGEDADEPTITAYREAIGAPSTPEGYELKDPGNLPDGVEFNEDFAKDAAEIAHKWNIPKGAMAELSELQTSVQVSQHENGVLAQRNALEVEKGKLEDAWSDDGFDEQMLLAKQALITFGYDQGSLQSDPALRYASVMQFAAKVGKAMGSDRLVNGGTIDANKSLEMQAKDIIQNPENPEFKAYHDPQHIDYKEVNAKVERMLEKGWSRS